MQYVFFFLTIFCGIFGAYNIISLIYYGIIEILCGERRANVRKRRNNNNKRDR